MAKQLDVRIDRSSPVPLYHQLAEQLAAAIDGGQLQPRGRLRERGGDGPTARPVAAHGAPGHRRARLARACSSVAAALGTTVANRKVHRRAELTSLYDDLARAGGRPTTTVLSLDVVQDERVAGALDLPADSGLLAIVRLRCSDGEPLAVMRNWLPPAHLDITRDELEAEGLYAVLRRAARGPSSPGSASAPGCPARASAGTCGCGATSRCSP